MKTTKLSGGGRKVQTKPLPAMGSQPQLSAMIGGVSNGAKVKSDKKPGLKR